jgi:hypothetical protein
VLLYHTTFSLHVALLLSSVLQAVGDITACFANDCFASVPIPRVITPMSTFNDGHRAAAFGLLAPGAGGMRDREFGCAFRASISDPWHFAPYNSDDVTLRFTDFTPVSGARLNINGIHMWAPLSVPLLAKPRVHLDTCFEVYPLCGLLSRVSICSFIHCLCLCC